MVSGAAPSRAATAGPRPYSDMEGGLYRAWLTRLRAALEQLGWMAEAGMAPHGCRRQSDRPL
jgi:allantoate deiminase